MSRGEFAAEFCDALDWDGDRTVDWFEFRDEAMGKALDQMHELRMEQALREVFDRVDESGRWCHYDRREAVKASEGRRGLRRRPRLLVDAQS